MSRRFRVGMVVAVAEADVYCGQTVLLQPGGLSSSAVAPRTPRGLLIMYYVELEDATEVKKRNER